MNCEIRTEEVAPRTLLSARDTATLAELPVKIPAMLGKCWGFIKSGAVKEPGLSVCLYPNDPHKPSLLDDEGAALVTGVEINAEEASSLELPEGLSLISTPAGKVATLNHIGSYNGLPEAHSTLRGFAAANDAEFAGPCWEVYGHWIEDESQLRTDIFYLLK